MDYLIDSEIEGVEYLALDVAPEILRLYSRTPRMYDDPDNEELSALAKCKAPHKFLLGENSIEELRADWELWKASESEDSAREEQEEYGEEDEMADFERRVNILGDECLAGLNAAKASASFIENCTAEADVVFVIRDMPLVNLGAAPIVSDIAKKTGAVVIEFMSYDMSPTETWPPSEEAEAFYRVILWKIFLSAGDIHIPLMDKPKIFFLQTGGKIRLFVQGIMDIFRSFVFQVFKEMIDKGADVGVGLGKGIDKVETGLRAAMESTSIKNFPEGTKARIVFVHFVTGPDVTSLSLTNALGGVVDIADVDSAVTWGHSVEESMGDTARVTVLISDPWKQREEDSGVAWLAWLKTV